MTYFNAIMFNGFWGSIVVYSAIQIYNGLTNIGAAFVNIERERNARADKGVK